MICQNKGCDNASQKGRKTCSFCRKAWEQMPKTSCASAGCEGTAALESHLCRFCINREDAMAHAARPITTGKKICGRCKEEKPVVQFNVNRDSTCGLDSSCKQCRKETKGTRGSQPKKEDTPDYEFFGGRYFAQLLRQPMPRAAGE